MFHTPSHKLPPDKTLADYYQRKYSQEMFPSFEEWINSFYVEINGTKWSRAQLWAPNEVAAAKAGWEAARK